MCACVTVLMEISLMKWRRSDCPASSAEGFPVWPLTLRLSPLIHHPILSATRSVALTTACPRLADRDWLISLLNFWSGGYLQSLLLSKTQRFDRFSQPWSLSRLQMRECLRACLFWFTSQCKFRLCFNSTWRHYCCGWIFVLCWVQWRKIKRIAL